MPLLLFSPEDPPVSDWWFQYVYVCLCVFPLYLLISVFLCLVVCSDPINSWPLTHTVNKHVEPSKFLGDLVSSSV